MDHVEQRRVDKAGIWLSFLCCIHCAITPIFIIFAPAFGEAFQSILIHILLLLAVSVVALVSFVKTYREQDKSRPLIFGLIGMVFLSFGIFIHISHAFEALHYIEPYINIIGGVWLITAHAINRKVAKCSHC